MLTFLGLTPLLVDPQKKKKKNGDLILLFTIGVMRDAQVIMGRLTKRKFKGPSL